MSADKRDETQVTAAYKALDANFTCRGHAFEVGKTYTVKGEPVICKNGYHACENPLDVLNYYDLVGSRFARVTLTGAMDRHEGDTKLCAANITIDAELSLSEWIGASVEWLIASGKGSGQAQAASGDSSKLAASGYFSQLAASGYFSQLAASGDSSRLEITGANSAAATVGAGSLVKASSGTPVAICEYNRQGKPIGFATGIAGTDFPADAWVRAKDGKLVKESA